MDNAYPYSFLRQLDANKIGLEIAEGDQLKMTGGSNLTTGQREHIIKNRGQIIDGIKTQLVRMGELINRVEQATTWSGLEQVAVSYTHLTLPPTPYV